MACLLPASGAAQTLDEIVARHLAARGGAARIEAVESLRMTGKARGPEGREALVVREIKRPARIRTEFTFQGLTGVYACDGEQGWQVSPLDGEMEPRPMPPESARLALEQADIGGPLLGWKAKGHAVELVGRVAEGGREAWKLKVTPKGGSARHLYLDAQSYLLVRTESARDVAGRTIEAETTFADYREVGGLQLAHSIEIGIKGRPRRISVLVEKVEINPVLDDARFRMPEASR
jgi:phosphoribosylformylglycinamidine (FGAM) synthase PurS component